MSALPCSSPFCIEELHYKKKKKKSLQHCCVQLIITLMYVGISFFGVHILNDKNRMSKPF